MLYMEIPQKLSCAYPSYLEMIKNVEKLLHFLIILQIHCIYFDLMPKSDIDGLDIQTLASIMTNAVMHNLLYMMLCNSKSFKEVPK